MSARRNRQSAEAARAEVEAAAVAEIAAELRAVAEETDARADTLERLARESRATDRQIMTPVAFAEYHAEVFSRVEAMRKRVWLLRVAATRLESGGAS